MNAVDGQMCILHAVDVGEVCVSAWFCVCLEQLLLNIVTYKNAILAPYVFSLVQPTEKSLPFEFRAQFIQKSPRKQPF